MLEFDAARKIAQGLGIHLEKSPSIVEVKGDKARLLPVAEPRNTCLAKRPQRSDCKEEAQEEGHPALVLRGAQGGRRRAEPDGPDIKAPKGGSTVLDRVHQAMILFAAGRSEALKSFLVDEGIGKDARFWKLAQSLSALYPPGIDEKPGSMASSRTRKGSVSDGDSQPDRSLASSAVPHPRIGRLGEATQGGGLAGKLRVWTTHLTGAIVETCKVMGWRAAARGHLGDVLPVARNEYLALDVIAFSESDARWPLPVAVFELENSRDDDLVAYSLWKVLCVRATLRVVFAYRSDVKAGVEWSGG